MELPYKLLDEHLDFYSTNLTDDMEIDTQNLVDKLMSQYLVLNNVNSNTDRMISFKINNRVNDSINKNSKIVDSCIKTDKSRSTNNHECESMNRLSDSLQKLYSKKFSPFAITVYVIVFIKFFYFF